MLVPKPCRQGLSTGSLVSHGLFENLNHRELSAPFSSCQVASKVNKSIALPSKQLHVPCLEIGAVEELCYWEQ